MITEENYRPVTCGENVPGYFEKKDGSNCTLDEDFKNGDCVFIPDESTAKITSSIMYLPYLHSITQFCDATIKNGHNYLAPSPQNIKCEYTPTWTVIAGHNDFRNLDKKNFKETNLKIIQPHVFAEPRFVIVMDVSGSMGYQDDPEVPTARLEYLRIAVTRFLSTIVPDNSEVGLVEFTSTATILTDLRKINSTSRTQLISILPIQPLDQTCIGCGLRKAIAVLSSNGQTAAGGTIILVTDGYNSGGYASIPDVMEEVLKAEVVVNAIAIGTDASPNLNLVAKKTGGNIFYFSGQSGALLQLDQAFVVSVHNQRDVETADIQSGKWKLVMDNTNNRPGNVSLIVTSKQRKKHSVPITVRCWLNNTVVDLSKSTNVVVFCHVLKGYNAVIKATVYVNIIDPLQHLYTLRLFDDGSGADSEANDGVYTAHFTEFKVDNRYSVTGTVTNDGKAQILKGTPASPAPRRYSGKRHGKPVTKIPITSLKRAPPGYVFNVSKPVIERAEDFQRSLTIDSFSVKNIQDFQPNKIQPSRVSDLKVVQSHRMSKDTVIVTLSWSSVGDNCDNGIANALDIRYSADHRNLLANFDKLEEVTENNVVCGSLMPLPPHHIQTIDLKLDGHVKELNLYFALKTIDDDRNASPLSNIAVAAFIDISTLPVADM
ncbi:Calcium-activated chloride channel regulator 4 [Nymphon striatum]|nr:Calcium-activated chloride channel regulator 4 [Nymphon striatum]